ncbi:hypothetical protein MJO29_007205 [Puccinia striiformis f. sp. tritici]|nr:hypothetical protein MJO29_007205 [Puccinia striiformis f. sp. tritici]
MFEVPSPRGYDGPSTFSASFLQIVIICVLSTFPESRSSRIEKKPISSSIRLLRLSANAGNTQIISSLKSTYAHFPAQFYSQLSKPKFNS